jgi:nucleotide-binding universal stress UspA family protein
MRHILLLTDFSKNSKNAIHYALQLFKDDMCVFYALYVKSSTSYTSDDLMSSSNQSIYQSLIKKEKTKLTKLVSALKVDFQNDKHNFQTIVDYDVFTDSINQVVKSKKIDLIIMGTNGVTGAKEVIFGSNTINVIRQVQCTALIIPEGFKYQKPKEILLALDGFDSLHGRSFSELVKFIRKYKLLLHILRINPYGRTPEVELSDHDDVTSTLKSGSFKYYVINNISMQHAVDSYLQTNPIDIMTLIVQKETLFERFFIGSPTTKISNAVRTPLLIVHS